jgi:molybdopterin-guanine dinucleotide biosynthesis protein A
MELTAIILAGGKSRRMGVNKALMSYKGKPLIQYSIDLALCMTANILISSNREELSCLGFPVVKDSSAVETPLAGIHAGLKASTTAWNLVLTCDMPNVSGALILHLLEHTGKDFLLVLPGHGEYLEPLCGLYHKDLVPVIESCFQRQEFAPLDLLGKVNYRIMNVEGITKDDPSFLFRNMNEKRDLLL